MTDTKPKANAEQDAGGDVYDFWESPSIEELARRQGVKPLHDVESLFGTWPGEDDDGFEEMIHAMRHEGLAPRDGA